MESGLPSAGPHLAEALPLPRHGLLVLPQKNPLYLKLILGEKPFLLVTSAMHMPRSVRLFRKQGLEPTVAVVDF